MSSGEEVSPSIRITVLRVLALAAAGAAVAGFGSCPGAALLRPTFPLPTHARFAGTNCLRYRPAARQPQMIDTSTSHPGFRCIMRFESPLTQE